VTSEHAEDATAASFPVVFDHTRQHALTIPPPAAADLQGMQGTQGAQGARCCREGHRGPSQVVFEVWQRPSRESLLARLRSNLTVETAAAGRSTEDAAAAAVVCGSYSGGQQRIGDLLVGTARVDLSLLLRNKSLCTGTGSSTGTGMAEICGWYHLLDDQQRCKVVMVL
jgi:hypothetical protein